MHLEQLRKDHLFKSATVLLAALFVSATPRVYAADTFTFAWPVPSKGVVTETVLKRGKTATTRYGIVLDKMPKSSDYELRFENFEFLELNGVDLSIPENRSKLGPMLKQITVMGNMIPSLQIDKDGFVVDVIGMDQMVERVTNLLPVEDEALRNSLKNMVQTPEMVAQLKEKTKDFWRVWVQTWSGFDLKPGQQKTEKTNVPVLGTILSVPMTLKNEGPVKDAPGYFKLTGESVLAGPAARKAFGSLMAKLVSEVPAKPGTKPFSPDMIKDMKRSQHYSVVTDPKTLQPREAHLEAVIDLTVGEETKSQLERRDYKFDWSK